MSRSERALSAASTAAVAICVLCFVLPAAVLLASYLWLASDAGQWNLSRVMIHESGRYTFSQTILYYNHFLRELPTLAILVLVVLAAHHPLDEPVRPRSKQVRAGALLLGASVLLAGAAFFGAAARHGWILAWEDLAQFRTRDELRSFGSHWRFHWLSTIWLGCAIFIGARIGAAAGVPIKPCGWRDPPLLLAVGIFAGASIIFGITSEIFVDARFVGHQLREMFTHALTTVPLATGTIWWLQLRNGRVAGPRVKLRIPLFELVLILVIPAFLAGRMAAGDVVAAGQTEAGLASMVGGHKFEHVLDYVFVVLASAGAYQLRWLPRLVERLRGGRADFTPKGAGAGAGV